jgi:hypothetical protein
MVSPNFETRAIFSSAHKVHTTHPIVTIVAESNWEYPSPQQFYNALRRKGWNTPVNHVEAMVAIHNRLNEDAWVQILKWESRGGNGVGGYVYQISNIRGSELPFANR